MTRAVYDFEGLETLRIATVTTSAEVSEITSHRACARRFNRTSSRLGEYQSDSRSSQVGCSSVLNFVLI